MRSDRLQTLLDPAKRLQLALSHSRLGDWTWDVDTDIVEMSPRGTEIFGLDPGTQITWDALRERLHPEDRERARIAVEVAIATASDYDIEYRVMDGPAIRWVSAKGRAVFDDGGRVLGMIGVVQDVSERKRTEDRLRESEQRFRVMADESPVMIWVTEPDGACTYLNRQWCQFTGLTLEQGLGQGWLSAVHCDDRASTGQAFLAANAQHAPLRIEYRLRRHDGALRWVLDAAVPRFASDGAFLGYIGSVLDISERKEYEEALRAGEERFRTLINAVPQLVWTSTPEGVADFLSRQWLDYTGARPSELLGSGWLSYLHPDDREPTTRAWDASVRSGGPYDMEFRIRGAGGVYRWFRTRAVPLRDAEGRVTRWIGTNTDIHDLKRTESDLRKANDDLNQFAYSASHDLQEPLRNLTIYSQLLKRRHEHEIPRGAIDLVNVIESSGLRMSELVHDLLLYTQAGSGDSMPPPPVESRQALENATRSLHAAIVAEHAEISGGELPRVPVHPSHLHLVLMNLIGNALKYRRKDAAPRVHVSAERNGGCWVFTVADNGIGIAREYHDRIFGLFKRLHGQQYSGTGLGLAICKKIVEHYGGRIWVESEPGMGSRFRFELPAGESTEET